MPKMRVMRWLLLVGLMTACGGTDPAFPPPVGFAGAAQNLVCNDEFWVCYDTVVAGTNASCASLTDCRACHLAPPPEGCCSGADETTWWHECTDVAYAACLPAYCDCAGDTTACR